MLIMWIANQFLEACDEFDGDYHPEAASRMRYLRYEHSKATNPNFSFTVPRYMTAYGETTFPWALMQDGRDKAAGKPHKCRWMRIFYEHSRMPDDFWRREGKFGLFDVGDTVAIMRQTYKLTAGHNEGLGHFIPASDEDQHRLDTNGVCGPLLTFTLYIGRADTCCSLAPSTGMRATRSRRSCTRMLRVSSATRSSPTSPTCTSHCRAVASPKIAHNCSHTSNLAEGTIRHCLLSTVRSPLYNYLPVYPPLWFKACCFMGLGPIGVTPSGNSFYTAMQPSALSIAATCTQDRYPVATQNQMNLSIFFLVSEEHV